MAPDRIRGVILSGNSVKECLNRLNLQSAAKAGTNVKSQETRNTRAHDLVCRLIACSPTNLRRKKNRQVLKNALLAIGIDMDNQPPYTEEELLK